MIEVNKQYKRNPFLEDLQISETKKLTKIKDAPNYKLVRDGQDVEDVVNVVYASELSYDKTPFLKLYNNDYEWIKGLSAKGKNALLFIFLKSKFNSDVVFFSLEEMSEFLDIKHTKNCYSVFNEMLINNVIARTTTSNVYYINVCLFFKGERRHLRNQ